MKRWMQVAMACMAGWLVMAWQGSDAQTILYVPQDDRPVSLLYTVDTAEDAGYTVLTPPKEMISGVNFHGDADGIWKWLDANAGKADALVISTDTLIYGGLVDSRKHRIPLSVLEYRVKELAKLKAKYPKVPIYAFGTIMRSPRASGGGVEPPYYSEYGPKIFRISALQDKWDKAGLSVTEVGELVKLQSEVPLEYLADWFMRRAKNMEINKMLIDETKQGVFSYFAMGHDDTSYYSQSDLEGRYLKSYSKGLPLSRYGSFPGADQLGLLLIARYYVDENHLDPSFSVIYPLGGAGKTIPHYEDQPVEKTIEEHVIAVGGHVVDGGKPDFVLAVNTPYSTETGESEAFGNLPFTMKSTSDFVARIKGDVDKGIPVAVADIAFSNGSDNTFVNTLYKNHLLYKLAAYNGWNTASNTIGYSIAQAILSKHMTAQHHKDMLTQQYLDNWAYQANIRKEVYRMQDKIRLGNVRYSDPLSDKLEPYMGELVQDFAAQYLGIDPRTVSARFPWNRLFETEIHVYDKPIAPLQKEIRIRKEAEERARQEAIARAKAAAEAKAKAEAEAKAKAEAAAKAKAAGAAAAQTADRPKAAQASSTIVVTKAAN